MFGTIEGTCSTSNTSINVNSRRTQMSKSSPIVPDSSSGTVKFVFSMENEEYFQCLNQLRMGHKLILIQPIHHIKEVLHVSHVLRWKVVLPSNTVPIGISSQCWYVTQQPVNLFIPQFLILVDVLPGQTWVLLGVEGGQSGHSGTEHPHRVCIIPEALHHMVHVAVDESMPHYLLLEGLQLGGRR